MPTDEERRATSSDTLQGWKDIAAYLGRSVRAAQRWERELGLPVHRIKTTDGQTVYANRAEINAWRTSRDLPKAQANDIEEAPAPAADSSDSPQPQPAPTPRASWPLRRWIWHALGAALTLAAGVSLGKYTRAPQAGGIVNVFAGGTKVVAMDAAGHQVWAHDMGRMVGQLTWRSVSPSGNPEPVRRLGKDGPILMALRTIPGSQAIATDDTLVAFDQKGRIRWQFSPRATLTCGAKTFPPPWSISGVIVSTRGAHPTALVSVTHNTWWPSEVYEIDETGRATLRYRQAGWIWSLAEWTVAGKRLLGIGGVLNEHAKASLTLIDLDGVPATAPHSDARFACDGSPQGQPLRVFLFPVMDVRVLGPYALTNGIKVLGNTMQAYTNESGGESTMEIDETLTPRRFELPDGYWVVHRSLEAKQLLTHPADACPESRTAHVIEEWRPDSGGWQSITIPPTPAQGVRKK